jgi:hypothetical protein
MIPINVIQIVVLFCSTQSGFKDSYDTIKSNQSKCNAKIFSCIEKRRKQFVDVGIEKPLIYCLGEGWEQK